MNRIPPAPQAIPSPNLVQQIFIPKLPPAPNVLFFMDFKESNPNCKLTIVELSQLWTRTSREVKQRYREKYNYLRQQSIELNFPRPPRVLFMIDFKKSNPNCGLDAVQLNELWKATSREVKQRYRETCNYLRQQYIEYIEYLEHHLNNK